MDQVCVCIGAKGGHEGRKKVMRIRSRSKEDQKSHENKKTFSARFTMSPTARVKDVHRIFVHKIGHMKNTSKENVGFDIETCQSHIFNRKKWAIKQRSVGSSIEVNSTGSGAWQFQSSLLRSPAGGR